MHTWCSIHVWFWQKSMWQQSARRESHERQPITLDSTTLDTYTTCINMNGWIFIWIRETRNNANWMTSSKHCHTQKLRVSEYVMMTAWTFMYLLSVNTFTWVTDASHHILYSLKEWCCDDGESEKWKFDDRYKNLEDALVVAGMGHSSAASSQERFPGDRNQQDRDLRIESEFHKSDQVKDAWQDFSRKFWLNHLITKFKTCRKRRGRKTRREGSEVASTTIGVDETLAGKIYKGMWWSEYRWVAYISRYDDFSRDAVL